MLIILTLTESLIWYLHLIDFLQANGIVSVLEAILVTSHRMGYLPSVGSGKCQDEM